MNRMSPSASAANGARPAPCTVLRMSVAPVPSMSARGAGSIEVICGRKPAVAGGARHEAGRMAGADLDDPGRLRLAHEDIERGGVEAGKPVLLPARLGRRRRRWREMHRRKPVIDFNSAGESLGGLGEDRLQRLIGRAILSRRHLVGVAIGDEEAALAEAEER